MTNEHIIASASALGIKLTRAEEGTEIYETWADRVRQADSHQFEAFNNDTASGYAAHTKFMREAIIEANRYAV